MIRKSVIVAILIAVSVVVSPIAGAGEVLSDTRVYRWDLTQLDSPGLGGFAHAILIGPESGTVVNTRFIVEFVTLDAWDASGVELGLVGPILQGDGTIGADIEVTGADFGWSGVGHFEVVHETDALNGPVVAPPGFPSSLWSMHLNDITNPYVGHFQGIRIELDVVNLVADDSCPGDLNGDAEVQPDDLRFFELGDCPEDEQCPADLNRDGVVTQSDREIMIQIFGNICPVAPEG